MTDEVSADAVRARERQEWELEKQAILEFEGHLAAATRKEAHITEANSLLIPLLTRLKPE